MSAPAGGRFEPVTVKPEEKGPSEKVEKTEEEWRAALTPEQYRILREKGTERAFTGKYWNHHGSGVYVCAACGNPLFDSGTKFESGTGWPSFTTPAQPSSVEDARGPQPLHVAHGGALPALRLPPGPCLRRRPRADGPALLHELGVSRLRSARW